jgi:hypothetical protein
VVQRRGRRGRQLLFLGIAEAREAIAGDTNGVAAVEGRRRVSESCGRDSSKPAAAVDFGFKVGLVEFEKSKRYGK